jgi:2-dehydro-3-deoxyphosphooctonate aldolase (KDO 8-P synthase)
VHSPFILIAGPCVVESKDLLFEVAESVQPICRELGFEYIFKASYRKANRTSANSFTGLGDIQALEYIDAVRNSLGCRTLTDIHESAEAELAARYTDILQIPAFLCRQTELLQAAARTGKTVNIKKGQFLAPGDMKKQADKVFAAGGKHVWLTERGTTFGYHDLVVDFRSLLIMRQTGLPVIYDATHSVQQPGGGEQSGGLPAFIKPLARAATAIGINGLFIETHPDPQKAMSDAATQLPLNQMKDFLYEIAELLHATRF